MNPSNAQPHAYGMIIGGLEVPARSGKTLDIRNPATGRVFATVPSAAADDVADAVAAAKTAFESGPWPAMTVSERCKLLTKFADAIDRHLPRLVELESRNNGRPIIEMRAQLPAVSELFRYNAALALSQRGETVNIGRDYHCYLERTPLGVCGVVTPFNHPLGILSRGVAPALASGNTVVAKPSETTPLTAIELAKIALEVGIPPGVFNVVIGLGAEAGVALSNHPDVKKLDFTGGTEAGRAISVAGAKRFAKVTTELGGKSPVIVFDDAGLQRAINGVAFGGYIAAGQTCICGSRLLIHSSLYDAFIDGLAAKVRGIRIGDPLDERTQMGPVVSAAQLERVTRYVEIAKDEGARVVVGGKRPVLAAPLDGGYFYEPTLLAGVKNEMRCAQEEIFGPALVAIPFDSEEDAIAMANDIDFGLGAAVWTRDVARAHRVASRIQSGMVWVNDHHRNGPPLPWGGVKESGSGKQAGKEAFDDFTTIKSVIVRIAATDVDWYGEEAPSRLN